MTNQLLGKGKKLLPYLKCSIPVSNMRVRSVYSDSLPEGRCRWKIHRLHCTSAVLFLGFLLLVLFLAGCVAESAAKPEVAKKPPPPKIDPFQQKINSARSLMSLGEYRRCLLLCDDILRERSDCLDALYMIGQARLKLFEQEKSDLHLEKAHAAIKRLNLISPNSAEPHALLAMIYHCYEVYPLAVRECEKALQLNSAMVEPASLLEQMQNLQLRHFRLTESAYTDIGRLNIYRALDPQPQDRESSLYFFVFTKRNTYLQHYVVLAQNGRPTRAIKRKGASPEGYILTKFSEETTYTEIKTKLLGMQRAEVLYQESKNQVAGSASADQEQRLAGLVKALVAVEDAIESYANDARYHLHRLEIYLKLMSHPQISRPLLKYLCYSGLKAGQDAAKILKDFSDEDRSFYHGYLAHIYFFFHAYPLATQEISLAGDDSTARVVKAALALFSQETFEKIESFTIGDEFDVSVYHCTSTPPSGNQMFDEFSFVVASKSLPRIFVYSLTRQNLRGVPRYYLYFHAPCVERLIRIYGKDKPELSTLSKTMQADLSYILSSRQLEYEKAVGSLWQARNLLHDLKRSLDDFEKELGE